jgi:hypothetical protein
LELNHLIFIQRQMERAFASGRAPDMLADKKWFTENLAVQSRERGMDCDKREE